MKSLKFILFVLVLLCLFFTRTWAGSIEGTFISGGKVPQDGVEILLIDLSTEKVVDQLNTLARNGKFIFWTLPPGRYGVVARHYLNSANQLDYLETLSDSLQIGEMTHLNLGTLRAKFPSKFSRLSLIADEHRHILSAEEGIIIDSTGTGFPSTAFPAPSSPPDVINTNGNNGNEPEPFGKMEPDSGF